LSFLYSFSALKVYNTNEEIRKTENMLSKANGRKEKIIMYTNFTEKCEKREKYSLLWLTRYHDDDDDDDISTLLTLETFTVNNGWARFIIFLFGNPHCLEGR